MKIRIEGRLAYVGVSLVHQGRALQLSKILDTLRVGDLELNDLKIQVGAMEHGFPAQGLIGLDFLLRSRADIDLGNPDLRRSLPSS